MANNNEQRKLTTEDVIHIGLATKSPGAYLVSSLIIELIKLPFLLARQMLQSLSKSKSAKKKAALSALAAAEAEVKNKEEYKRRMAERKKAYLQRAEQKRRQDIVASMMPKQAQPEVDSKIGDEARSVWREEAAPGLIFDDYLYAWELFKTKEGHAFVSARGLSPDSLTAKLKELHEQNKHPKAPGGMRLTPLVRMALYSAGNAARERFKSEHPGESGVAEVTINDLLAGAINTKNFVSELDAIWEHLRKGK